MGNIKALIVDDSAFMRKSLSIMLSSDTDIEIVGTAKNGLEGFDLAKKLRPDIITLDIEMPVMDGLSALKKIMAECPTSVIMVSSLTTEGADATIQAMEYGAVDFIPKEMSFVSVNIVNIREELIKKIKAIVKQKSLRSRLERLQSLGDKTKPITSKQSLTVPRLGYKAVGIGISTGGPLSLQKLIPFLDPKANVPFFIVQHMPPKFTKSLADRLNSLPPISVKEAENNEIVKKGWVYLAPGGYHMTVYKNAKNEDVINISDKPSDTLHKPCVDVMIKSLLRVYGKQTLGVIMTGMGKDGFEAIKELKSLGGYCVAQNEESCVVYGMPKAVVDAGYADAIVPLEKIYETINKAL
ncbi:MAG TPA: chemotaxis response regulator protein-glutamate methylesterase [Melioribacteraceae bacterium]|nr:chemotaxis response regulator protein-glutamate methylesterase [Melioribacteraceae bacterium]